MPDKSTKILKSLTSFLSRIDDNTFRHNQNQQFHDNLIIYR